jgi:hypothetical protein
MPELNEDDSKLLREVLSRSAVDAEFRSQLIKNPHAAVKTATGVVLPSDLKLRFVEQPKDVDAYIVMPNFVDADSELTSDELEAVAGGVMDELAAVCWDTCKTTCDKSCDKTCDVTSVTVSLEA